MKRDIITGLLIIAIVVFGIILIRKAKTENSSVEPSAAPSISKKIEDKFGGIEIPNDEEKVELNDVSGGDSYGIATKDAVLADLPEPETGYFYQAWEEKAGNYISLGKMRIAKGGWVFNGTITGPNVYISKEKVFDGNIEDKILQGTFSE